MEFLALFRRGTMLVCGMNADAEALMEQALQHVLEETGKLLKRDNLADVKPIITSLNDYRRYFPVKTARMSNLPDR